MGQISPTLANYGRFWSISVDFGRFRSISVDFRRSRAEYDHVGLRATINLPHSSSGCPEHPLTVATYVDHSGGTNCCNNMFNISRVPYAARRVGVRSTGFSPLGLDFRVWVSSDRRMVASTRSTPAPEDASSTRPSPVQRGAPHLAPGWGLGAGASSDGQMRRPRKVRHQR